jgi:hypothetical protein
MLTRLLLAHALMVTILFVNRVPSAAQIPEAAKSPNVSVPSNGQDQGEGKDKGNDSKRAEDPAVQDSFIIRQLATKLAFENDGTETRETSAQIQVLSDAGVQRWGVVSFSYHNINETLDIDYVRVKKADGSIVVSPPENIQDITSEISRVAPLYTDEREKHVAVKGLSPGDVLEYSVRSRIAKPPIPGQFWAEYSFERNESVMNETLEISVPAAREIKFKNRGPGYVLSTEGDRRTYRWTHSNPNPKNKDDEAGATWKLARGGKEPSRCASEQFQVLG